MEILVIVSLIWNFILSVVVVYLSADRKLECNQLKEDMLDELSPIISSRVILITSEEDYLDCVVARINRKQLQ